jgi:hypothetical protein
MDPSPDTIEGASGGAKRCDSPAFSWYVFFSYLHDIFLEIWAASTAQ